jgi:hypothetical protein
MKIIMLEAFLLKSILYVIKMVDEIKEKLPPKYTQNEYIFFCLKWPPRSVLSLEGDWVTTHSKNVIFTSTLNYHV